MSTEQGFLRQAIYCLNKVVHGDRTDVHAQWDRAVLYTDLGHHKRVPPTPHLPPRCLAISCSGVHLRTGVVVYIHISDTVFYYQIY